MIGGLKGCEKMWRRVWSSGVLKQSLLTLEAASVGRRASLPPPPCAVAWGYGDDRKYKSFDFEPTLMGKIKFFSTDSTSSDDGGESSGDGSKGSESDSIWKSKPKQGFDNISFDEAKKLMRLVNVEALKMKLGMDGKEVIGYDELIEACKNIGIARTADEATAFARVLDDAGVVLLFRDKVYLHPDKVYN